MKNYELRGLPTFRITNYEKAVEFYVGLLSFTLDWEHRFSPTEPVYMQVSKKNLILHLSENKRFKTGAVVFVETIGIENFRNELLQNKSGTILPKILKTPWQTLQMEMEDPFGNLLRLNDNTKSD